MLSSLAFAAEGFETELHVPLGIRQLFQDAHINKPVLASVLWTAKASDVQIGFLDRFTGSVVIAGDVESVWTALRAVNDTLERVLGFTVAEITRT